MSGSGPLDGIRVLELGSFIAGPFAGQLLADLGADVIKVENPEGDSMRSWGTCLDGRAIWWSALQRGKRLVAVDLRTDEGRETVRRLAAGCDVVLENFAPGRLEAWGLGYEQLSAANPKLVMTRVSGFGQTGPRAHERGFGAVGEAMGGLRELTGSPDRPPSRSSVSVGDHVAGLFAALGTLAAVRQAERDGQGQVVDVALYEAVLALTESLVADYELTGYVRTRAGGGLPGAAPSNAYPSSDGKSVVIAATADAIWARLAKAMGRPDLADDERYAKHTARGERADELDDLVGGWTRTLTADALDEALTAAAVPHGLVYTAPDILTDEHIRARGAVQRVHDAALGRNVPMVGVVPRLSRTPGTIRWAGGPVGADNETVLAELVAVPPQASAPAATSLDHAPQTSGGPDDRAP